MDLYTPTRIEEVFRRSPRVTTFLKSTFFKGSKTFVTKSVNFDIVEGSRSVAPFVNPKAGGQVIPNKGYSTKTYTAPLVSPEKVTEAEEMLNRIAGEQITSSMTPAERAVRKLSEDLVEMDEMITAAAMESDSAKRSELNAAIQQKALDECIIVPIYQQEDIHCHSADLEGFRNGAYQAPLLKYCYFA